MKTPICIAGLVIALVSAPGLLAADCSVTIDSTDSMEFSTDEITVDGACEEIELTLTHSGDLPRNAMGHNWVLTRADDAQAAYNDGMQAGLDNEYVEPGDDRIIAYTPVIGGGEETTITFAMDKLDPEGQYTFFCSFPGHFNIMQGSFNITGVD